MGSELPQNDSHVGSLIDTDDQSDLLSPITLPNGSTGILTGLTSSASSDQTQTKPNPAEDDSNRTQNVPISDTTGPKPSSSSTSSFAQSLFVHNNSAGLPPQTPVYQNPHQTKVPSPLSPQSGPRPFHLPTSNLSSVSPIRRLELTKSRNFYEHNVPLPPVPKDNDGNMSGSTSSSLLDLDDSPLRNPTKSTSRGGKNLTPNAPHPPPLAPPPVPPKDPHLQNLASRNSRVEPLVFNQDDFNDNASLNNPSNGEGVQYFPFNHTNNSTRNRVSRQVESRQEPDYVSYTQTYDDYDLDADESDSLYPSETHTSEYQTKKYPKHLSRGWNFSNASLDGDKNLLINNAQNGNSNGFDTGPDYRNSANYNNNGPLRLPTQNTHTHPNSFAASSYYSNIDEPGTFDMNQLSASMPPFDYDNYSIRPESMSNNRPPSPPLPDLPPGGVTSDHSDFVNRELQKRNVLLSSNPDLVYGNTDGPPVAPYSATHPNVYYPEAGGGIAGTESNAPNGVPYQNPHGRHRKPPTKAQRMMERPWLVYILTTIQTIVFLIEFIRMGILTGSPIQTKPIFNPMIGPSSYVLINMGARFTPCMHGIANVTDDPTLLFPCANSTAISTDVCTLAELCGMGWGVLTPEEIIAAKEAGDTDPNSPALRSSQWWRFITPIFLHAGILHLGFNMLLQVRLGAEMERTIGHVRFFLVYFVSGIGGFLLGGNFTPDGIASTGASGSLFGIISLDLLDLLFNWSVYRNPYRSLVIHFFEFIISFVIGLLPGLDNFSHIGGFVMGLLIGTAVLPSPRSLRKKKRDHLRMLVQNQSQREMELELNNGSRDVDGYENVSLTTFRHRSIPHHGGTGVVEEYQDDMGSKKNGTVVTTRVAGNDGESSGSSAASSDSISDNSSNQTLAPGNMNPFTTNPSGSKSSANMTRPLPFEYDDATLYGSNSRNGNQRTPSSKNSRGGRGINISSQSRNLINSRPRSWYTWMAVRVACLAIVIAYYIGLIINFQRGGGHCTWCKYLSCLPVHGWCDIGNIAVSMSSSSSTVFGYFLIYATQTFFFSKEKRKYAY